MAHDRWLSRRSNPDDVPETSRMMSAAVEKMARLCDEVRHELRHDLIEFYKSQERPGFTAADAQHADETSAQNLREQHALKGGPMIDGRRYASRSKRKHIHLT